METNPLDLAKGISDFGIMVIICAFFLIAFVYLFKRFIKSYDDVFQNFTEQQEIISQILANNREQLTLIKNIQENIGDQKLAQVSVLVNYAFYVARVEVLTSVQQIVDNNGIHNRKAIERKVRETLENLHGNRNRNFEMFTYAGRPLSQFTNPEWINRIADIMLEEIYAQTHNYSRLENNLKIAYEKIKVEFHNNLRS